jgi:hypothetical protein
MIRVTNIVPILLAGLHIAGAADAPEKLSQTLQARLDAYHRTAERKDHKLRLVYFHPNDAPPQAGYRERLTRIMLDIRDFIAIEMKRNGFHERSINLEMEDDSVKLHLVEGRDGTDGYNYDQRYGAKILREMRAALKGTVDFDREFVLAFCGICPRDEKGVYHFRSPYYGWGNSGAQHGLCFAADCEVLDTKNFTATNRTFRYTEHQGPYEKKLSDFNILYIGGIAHELGHGLGLPHNREKPWEKSKMGPALMGSGNYTYRNELIGGKGSFLTKASALRLATHPIFTGSDRERFRDSRSEVTDLKVEKVRGGMRIKGRVSGSPEIFAAIGYTDPEGGSNYDAHTWLSEVKGGEFDLTVRYHRKGPHALRFNFCHLNGGISDFRLDYDTDDKARPVVAELNAGFAYRQAEAKYLQGDRAAAKKLAKANINRSSKGKFADMLRHLVELPKPVKLVELSATRSKRVSLSDAAWEDASVGWGRPARNQYYVGNGIRDGVCIELGGEFHAKALYAHAPASHVFELDGKWKKLTAVVGLQNGVSSPGSGVFVVTGDGKELQRTKVLRPRETTKIEVDVTGVDRLEVIAESGKEGNAMCWTVWGSPFVTR